MTDSGHPHTAPKVDFELIQRARQGAHRVLKECLHLRPGEHLALFYDETTKNLAELLLEAAKPLKIKVVQREVSISEQVQTVQVGQLPLEDQDALAKSRAILVCLDSSVQVMPYRKLLIRKGLGEGPLGTMPGATLEVLAHAVNVDYSQCLKQCGDLAVALLVGEFAKLTTYIFDEQGLKIGKHELELHLGGFARSPITSPGIIMNGTWGNLPGGETFIAPVEGKSEGVFVLNGSFKGHVLRPGRHILLHFHKGDLAHVEGSEPEAQALRDLLNSGTNPGSRLGLAEMGIGVNPGIPQLTGSSLFDEKKEGTIHVAVGDNEEYGGLLSSRLHEDFVSCLPSLSIDDRPILVDGKWSLEPTDWRESKAQALELGRSLPGKFMVQRRITFGYPEKGRLMVRRFVGTKRTCVYSLGMEEIGRDLANLYECIPDTQALILFELLQNKYREKFGPIESDYLRGMLAVLDRHQLVAIETRTDGSL